MDNTKRKMHGRENDSVEVVEEVQKSEVALREEDMQAFWVEHDIFNKSIKHPAGLGLEGDKVNAEGREGALGHFVFYDGPPFATGLPHYGHILAGTIKDAIPRFWTMNGYRVRRKWGWDCHGLPLENLIEKRLGLATKRDIEEYGIQNFNESARDAVMEYADDWKQIIPRMGRWADMEDDYKTMDSTYTESVWWVFKSLHEKGLVFEGFKSMHLCPRCGTTLSNFEVNQGYKDIKDIAITVKLPLLDEAGNPTDTSLLVWTTTPWTMPGNLAAAVHQDYEYVKVKITEDGEESCVILAKERLVQLDGHEYEEVETMLGSDLVGKKYEPPFPWLKEQDFADGKEHAWTIYHADYVELGEEGTGAVHLAPAYGEDDMVLAKEHQVPIVHHVDEAGHFKDFVTDFAGQLVKPKDDDEAGVSHLDADIEIVKALKANGKLLKKENITHSYPHCWRCDTPLLNYATTSWFVDVPSIKDKLVAENNNVHWVPEHVGKNRFGKWLEGARDWAVSRQRYWGAPLPIWKNPETSDYKVLGSLAELQEYVPKSNNTYVVMRHGESKSNVQQVISCNKENNDGLTQTGKEQVVAALQDIPRDIDVIIHSGFQRTRETAELVRAHIPQAELIEDDTIRELDIADEFEGKTWDEYNAHFATWEERYTKELPGSENRRDAQKRMGAFIYALEKKYQGKKILLVSHAGPIFALECAVAGLTPKEAKEHMADGSHYPKNAEVREITFTPIPHNDNFELDFHRPYIDHIELYEGTTKLERIPDVFDCWFESGSMPYGQHHYPFTCDDTKFQGEHFPAQFIAEGLDQTRGWFYSLIVLGTALFGKSPYENVIVNGLVLAEDGKKMSKSLQNYPDPMELANRTGVDAMRFYLLSAPIMRGEDLNFSEKEVLELQRKNIGRLHNVLAMYEMFADGTKASDNSDHVLDKWIVARLNQLIAESTAGYKNYELDKATRPITDFIDDLSVWYLRRSRDRFKGEDVKDKTKALATLRYTLRTLALVMAPAMPFYAEYLWQQVKEETDAESVHLGVWPEGGVVDAELLEKMQATRDVVTQALEARTKANIKVRQPIAAVSGPQLDDSLASIVLDELNAKAYQTAEKISIDTALTPELLAEGAVRELMRAVQGKRKADGLEPADRIALTIKTDEAGQAAIEANQELLTKTVGASELTFVDTDGEEVRTGDYSFVFSVVKV
jgi:isoleucyl-tRNA synthetase